MSLLVDDWNRGLSSISLASKKAETPLVDGIILAVSVVMVDGWSKEGLDENS